MGTDRKNRKRGRPATGNRQPATGNRQPATGNALPAAERMRRMRDRRKTAGFRSVSSWQPTAPVASAKYVAGREKDLEFTRELARHRMTDKATLLARLRETEVLDALRTVAVGRIERDFPAQKRTTARGSHSRE